MEVEREDPVSATETDSQVDQELTPAVRECVVGETANENGNAQDVNEILSLMNISSDDIEGAVSDEAYESDFSDEDDYEL